MKIECDESSKPNAFAAGRGYAMKLSKRLSNLNFSWDLE